MIKKLIVIIATYIVAFMLTTIVTDLICQYNGYYTECAEGCDE